MDMSPFNEDELAAQQLAGGGPPGWAIRDFMPDQHRGFFALLPYLRWPPLIATAGLSQRC